MTEVCFSPGRAAFHFRYVSELRRLSALCVCYIKYEDLSCFIKYDESHLIPEVNPHLRITLLYYYTHENSQHSQHNILLTRTSVNNDFCCWPPSLRVTLSKRSFVCILKLTAS